MLQAKKLQNNKFLHINLHKPRLGQQVFIFGYLANEVKLQEYGYILNTEFDRLIDLNIPTYHSSCRGGFGYSGGPLVDENGEVIGVHKSCTDVFKDIFDSAAIPSSVLRDLLSKLATEAENGWIRN